jgi:hypothetical protein
VKNYTCGIKKLKLHSQPNNEIFLNNNKNQMINYSEMSMKSDVIIGIKLIFHW